MARHPKFSRNLTLPEQLQPGDAVAPLGYHVCSVDAKGRLKIPAAFLRYMGALGSQFFLTSSDELDIQIYSREAFVKQCAFLEQLALDADYQDDAEDTLFRMKDLGDDVSPDTDGRVHLPQVLRQRLGVTELPASCQMGKDRDHLVVMTATRYEAMREKGRAKPADSAKRMRLAGLR